jgi:hypothetical protein
MVAAHQPLSSRRGVEIVKRTIDMTSELQGMDVRPQSSSRRNEHPKKVAGEGE